MSQHQLVVLSLVLLLTGAVVSSTDVSGVVGRPVTLPCTYSVASGVTSMCWGRGQCPFSKCSNQIIWTDGSHVTFRKETRYELEGNLLQGDVSLTIKNVKTTDSGLYCCRVERRGWFNDLKFTLSLDVMPESPTSVPSMPKASTSAPPPKASTSAPPRPASTQRQTPGSPTRAPTSPRASTSAPPPRDSTSASLTSADEQRQTPVATSLSPASPTTETCTTLQETSTEPASSPLYSGLTDGNGTVTQSSDGFWNSTQTHVFPSQSTWLTTTKGLYLGISVCAFWLLVFLITVIISKHYYLGRKMESLSLVSFKVSQTGALQSATEGQCRAKDNIYIIEDNLYVMD